MNSPWLQCFVPRPGARLRLVCFAHAGGSAGAYRPWCQLLPDSVELWAVQLPARANRLKEAPITRMGDIVDGVVQALRPLLDRPYALFGHSMGAVLANEVARQLRHAGAPLPSHLFASGRRPPHWPNPDEPLHVLGDAAFVAEIQRRYGGIPPEVAAHQELMEMLLPSLRADIHALENHLPPAGRLPLACPVSVFGGSDDPLTPHEHLEGWHAESTGPVRVRVMPGDHFYLHQQREALLGELCASLAPLLAERQREAAA